jgi:protein SCO1
VIALLLALAGPVLGADAAPVALTVRTLPDVALVDQAGQERRLWSDLVKDQVVAMNFIFTTCPSICPPMGASFAELQHRMVERGSDVRFISITIDPVTDTPARLSEWAAKFSGTAAWTLLTGPSSSIDDVLNALGVRSAVKGDHSPVVVLGNARTGQWTRAHALAAPDELVALIEGLDKP